MSFAHPLLLVLGIVCLALLAAAYRGFIRRKTANALTYSNLAFAAAALRASRVPGRLLLAGFLVSGAALAIAIGGPRFFSRVPSHDATVVICIDTSGSMRAEDLAPTRSAAAQAAARAFVAAAPSGTRIGIVTFSTGASVLLAPTSDLETVRDALDRIPPPNGGTAIGDALELAASTMPAQGQRAIVLLTDGVNNRGVDPVQASQQVGAQGIRIETVGIGSNGSGETIPGTNEAADLDVDDLRQIAGNGDGQYVGASDAAQLSNAFRGLAAATVWERKRVDGSLPFALGGGIVALATFLAALGLGRL